MTHDIPVSDIPRAPDGYPDTPFQRLLADLDACATARSWVGEQDFHTAWAACQTQEWFVWFLETTKLVTCSCRSSYGDPLCRVKMVETASVAKLKEKFPSVDVARQLVTRGLVL